jgi:TonB family protein
MTLNTQNSFLISAFLHLLFIAAFVALPKPEYTVKQLIDISFLFSNIENEPQTNKKAEDKSVLKNKVVPMKTDETHMSNIDTKGNENVIPAPDNKIRGQAPAGIQTPSLRKQGAIHKGTGFPLSWENLDSRLHGNDGLEVFSDKPLKENEINQEYQKAHSSLVETVGMPIEQKTETLTYGTYGSSASGTSDLPSSYASTAKVKGISDIKPLGFGGSKDAAASAHTGTAIDKSAIISSFVDRIESLKHYPYIARRRGIQGTVLIFVHLNKNGELKDVVLRKSSGHEILDMSAVELIKKATPFRHGYHSNLKIEIPITYKLMR